jgi:hypothetical protein
VSYESPAEERHLQYLARAEQARLKSEHATDAVVREWWQRAAEGWHYLADHSKPQR